MAKEAKARIKINKLLEEAGWRFFDSPSGPANIQLETNVKLKDFGDNFESIKEGFVDYLLLDKNGFPACVLEAKSEEKDPLTGKEQARQYARSQNVRFIILSNGNLHYFWDMEGGNPTVITAFPAQDSLKHFHSFTPNKQRLSEERVEDDYIAVTQYPDYGQDPRWLDPSQQENFLKDLDLKFLRGYQLNAIKALQKSASEGSDRYLFEMATGTGKTLIAAAIIKLFLRTGNARRVLFLVDRLELEDQAWKSFVKYLKNDFSCVIYKENRDDWKKAEIVVSTVQSLSFDNKYKKLFSPTDFECIISDEAHRSIGGNSRAVFEYFVGYKLGLTATPKDYLKKIDPNRINQKDPREWERRQLLDTYRTFGCESGKPTFRYSLIDGVKEGYLVNPVVIDARTEITTQLLSENGYSIMVEDEDGVEGEQTFFLRDFEKKFFSEKTNEIFCKTFFENALHDEISGEIGKTLIFCVSQKHASKITQVLNKFAQDLYPDKYNSDFAVQVTSSVSEAQQYAINFSDKNNRLNGNTKFLEGYKTSKTRVCVTVGMMTTGYDCQDILNLCLMRPIFSPTDFVQMKGRGTRKYLFRFYDNNNGNATEIKVEKEKFKLFDFFANCEYFEEKYDYDEILTLPPETGTGGGGGGIYVDEISIYTPDPLKTFSEKAIGVAGMKIDRKFFEHFEEKIKCEVDLKERYEKGDLQYIEEFIRNEVFDKPEEYYNLEKLRQSIKADRRISLKEFIMKIFGGISRFKSKDELLEEECDKFIAIQRPESQYVVLVKNFIKAYITDAEVREIVESKEYSRLATNPKISMEEFKRLGKWRGLIPEYVKDYVPLNKYM